MNATENKTCADLVRTKMQEREEEFKALAEEDEYSDPALSITTHRLTTVCLSWGGPADYLEIKWEQSAHHHEIISVMYRYSDWFDTAVTQVEDDSPLWEYAMQVVEYEAEA